MAFDHTNSTEGTIKKRLFVKGLEYLDIECHWKGEKEQMNTKLESEEGEKQHMLHQTVKGVLNRDCFLLDNQTTVDQFVNQAYLTKIHSRDMPVLVFCNAGSTSTNKKGYFGSLEVLFDSDGITNVVLSKTRKENYRVTYKSHDKGGIFKVYTKAGVAEFMPHGKGLHHLELSKYGNLPK